MFKHDIAIAIAQLSQAGTRWRHPLLSPAGSMHHAAMLPCSLGWMDQCRTLCMPGGSRATFAMASSNEACHGAPGRKVTLSQQEEKGP